MKTYCLLFFFVAGFCLLYGSLSAAEKVVVVPLGSNAAAGRDKQVQYNDGGNTAGAEMYYSKSNRMLEVHGEIRTTDNSGKRRLWGQGRPETQLITHDTPTGHCTYNGVNYALSYNLSTWNSTDSVCPSGTWVCRQQEITPGCALPAGTYTNILCNGSNLDGNSTTLFGWNADANPSSPTSGEAYRVFGQPMSPAVCNFLRVWCCWE